jgi:hypothetical protein
MGGEMIGLWRDYSSPFLIVVSVLTILLGSPMFFHPLGWASVLRWRLPEDSNLAVYFGRCLGGVVTVLAIMGFWAAEAPSVQPFYFTLLLAAVGVNILAHIWGAIQKIQPLTETVEIAFWILLFLSGLLFYPAI